MELTELYDIQRELDDYIRDERLIDHDLNLVDSKIVALKVEIAEMFNEQRFFKFWSRKKPSENKVILEELVDVLHFLLSIGNDRNYRDFITEIDKGKHHETDMTELAMNMMENPVNCASAYHRLFSQTLAIGFKYGFVEPEIKNAYLTKNKINHERQVQRY